MELKSIKIVLLAIIIFTKLVSAYCTKSDILNLVNAGYNKSEINNLCNDRIIYKVFNYSRFNFSILYPANILTEKDLPEDGSGAILSNKSHTVELRVWAMFNVDRKSIRQIYRENLYYIKHNRNCILSNG